MTAWIAPAAVVLAAIITALATYRAAKLRVEVDLARREADAFKQAPYVFAEQLGNLISRAASQDPTNADAVVVSARAIVAARNSLAEPLRGLSVALNHEIDELQDELGRGAAVESLSRTIRVLREVWPTKRSEIELRMKQLQTIFESIGSSASSDAEARARARTRAGG